MEFANDGPKHRGQRGFGGRRNRPLRRLWMLVLLIVVFAIALIYGVFFRIHNAGVRTVTVNGENVEQINGFSIRSTTWLSRSQAQRFLKRIHASGVSISGITKRYRGTVYVRAADVVSALNSCGDRSQFAGGRLQVTLKSNQHYTYRINGDTVRQQEIVVNGRVAGRILTLSHDEATYVPTEDTAKSFSKAGLKSRWTGKQLNMELTGTPSPASVQKPNEDSLIAFGAGKAIFAPKDTWQSQAYLPVLSLDAALRQLGWKSSFGTWKWTLTSAGDGRTGKSQAGLSAGEQGKKPAVLAFVPFYSGNLGPFDDVMSHKSSFSAIAMDTWTVDSTGRLVGSAPAGTANQAAAAGDKLYAMVTNMGSKGFDAKEMTSILKSSGKENQLHNEIVNSVAADGYDGALLDFELIPSADRLAYSNFVANLAKTLHTQGKKLEVAVPPDTGSGNEPWNDGYDLAKLGQAADSVVLMAYDYSYAGGPAGPIAPVPWVQQSLAYTVSRVPANKVLLGIDAYGYDWAGGSASAVSLSSVDSFLASRHISPNWDMTAEAPWYSWTDSQGTLHTVYYENAKSTQAKLKLAQAYGIAGAALWRAGLENDTVLNVLSGYAKGKIY